MENTKENKKRFFAQYFGQKVWRCELHDKVFEVDYEVLLHCGEAVAMTQGVHVNEWLELIPLSNITDEDAIEVGIKSGRLAIDSEKRYDVFRNTFGEVVVGNIGESIHNRIAIKEDYLSAEIFDFLRTKGYALSYNGLSVEELEKRNWIKLTQNK